MDDATKPFWEWLVSKLDAPLAAIGMSKTQFFSMLMILLSVSLALPMKGQAAVVQEWLRDHRAIIEAALIGGIGFGISSRMFKMQNPSEPTVPPRYF